MEGSKFGRVSSAEMHLRGHLFEARIQIANQGVNGTPEEDGLYTLHLNTSGQAASPVDQSNPQRLSMQPTVYLDTPMMPHSDSMTIYLLPICSGWRGRSGVTKTALAGLILSRTGSTTATAKYERVGIFGLDQKQVSTLCGSPDDQIKILEKSLAGMRKDYIVLV
jgi:hypothetical protein